MLPGRQAHVNFRGIGGAVNQFRRRLAGDGPMQLVLHRGKKLLRHRRVRLIIHRQRINIRELLVKPPLAGADFPDALQQLVEIILAERLFAPLQPLVVHHETLDDEFPERLRGPDAELRGLKTVHPVAHGDDGVEIVITGGIIFAVGGSCFQNGNN